MPASHARGLVDRPTPEIRRPAAKRKSQLSMKMRMTSHLAIGIDVKPARRVLRTSGLATGAGCVLEVVGGTYLVQRICPLYERDSMLGWKLLKDWLRRDEKWEKPGH